MNLFPTVMGKMVEQIGLFSLGEATTPEQRKTLNSKPEVCCLGEFFTQ